MRWIYYKLWQVLQSAMIITNCDSTRVIGIRKRWTNPLWHCSFNWACEQAFQLWQAKWAVRDWHSSLFACVSRVNSRHSPKFTIFSQTIMHLVNPPIFFGSIVFNFSWVSQSSQKKSKTMVMNFFFFCGGGKWRACLRAIAPFSPCALPLT